MKFQIKRVRYKNIMSVGAQPVDISFEGYHKTLCTGKNGASKSTMIEALYFGLYGKPYRNIKKPQLVNTINKKNLEVEVWFSHGKDEFYVLRGIKPNKLKIEKNGVALDEAASVKDFQEYFESMIGISASSFKQIVVLGTAGYVPFMCLTAAARRALVEDLLGVSVLSDMDKLNKIRLREISQGLEVCAVKISHLTQHKQSLMEIQNKQQQDNADVVGRYVAMKQEQLDKAKLLNAEIQDLNDCLANIALGDNPATEIDKYQRAMYKLQTQQQQYSSVQSMHERGGVCPTCMQKFENPELVDRIKIGLTGLSVKLNKLKERLAVLVQQRKDYEARVQEVNSMRQQLSIKNNAVVNCMETANKLSKLIEQQQQEKVDQSEKIAEVDARLHKEVEAKAELMMEKYHRTNVAEMLRDSGVKAVLLKKYIPFFNQRIAHYLKIMEADYVFTLDEQFNESIKSGGREEFSYESFSQGERARIDIALLFTWRDVAAKVSGTDVNLLILDEVFDGSGDNDCSRTIMDILNSMDANILIISHREHDLCAFNRHIQMAKKGRFSVATLTDL